MNTNKTCSCGKTYDVPPSDSKLHVDSGCPELSGWYWNCSCKSTMFVPAENEDLEKRSA